jgi:hypothetical protein
MKNSRSLMPSFEDKKYRDAVEVLRNRMLVTSQYSDREIRNAVLIVKQADPDHPLLRYSERGPLELHTDE